jgi:hypothetical protein
MFQSEASSTSLSVTSAADEPDGKDEEEEDEGGSSLVGGSTPFTLICRTRLEGCKRNDSSNSLSLPEMK